MLDALFWACAAAVRYGAGENLSASTRSARSARARPSAGLARTLARTVITTYGRDFATAMTEFRRDGSAGVGRQSQTWVRLPDGWRVVAAHVSLIAPMSAVTLAAADRRHAAIADAARKLAEQVYDTLKAQIHDFELVARRPLLRDRARRSASA